MIEIRCQGAELSVPDCIFRWYLIIYFINSWPRAGSDARDESSAYLLGEIGPRLCILHLIRQWIDAFMVASRLLKQPLFSSMETTKPMESMYF
jgi:hypothetical protein